MVKIILTRKILRNKLIGYSSKFISLAELQEWSDEIIRKDPEFDDWEGDDSLTNEIIKIIELSDVDGLSLTKTKKIIKLLESDLSANKLIMRLYKINGS